MRRLLRLASPSFSALILRVVQFLILVALGQLVAGAPQQAVIASFGIVTSFAILADSGAVNYLLSRANGEISSGDLGFVVSLHAGLAAVGAIAAVLYVGTVFGDSLEGWLGLIVALAVSQAIDGSVRVLRAPLLTRGQDHRSALIDAASAILKAMVVMMAFAAHSALALCLLPLASLVVAAMAFPAARTSYPKGARHSGTARAVLSYGLGGASSALYSQTPLLISGLVLAPSDVATLSVAYQVVQPVEIVPATLAQQAVPRLVVGRLRPLPTWVSFFAAGALVAIVLLILAPTIEWLVAIDFSPYMVFLLLAASLPLKFGNYLLVATLYARRLVARRTTVSLAVGFVASGLAWLAAALGGATSVAGVTIVSEALLAFGLLAAILLRERRYL